jgi:ribonuclease I
MTRFLIPAALGALLLTPLAAIAQEQDSPGQFDFYVLSLSWSPSFCAAAAERGRRRAANASAAADSTNSLCHRRAASSPIDLGMTETISSN